MSIRHTKLPWFYEEIKMSKCLKVNLNIMIKQKTFMFAFFIMLVICTCLPFVYFMMYRGCFEYQMPAAYSVFVGNEMGLAWKYIQLIMTFLIIFPYSMSFYNDYVSGANIYYQTRSGRRNYYMCQMLTCFVGGMIIIAVPFLVNIVLNSIIFPVHGNDYITTQNKYSVMWSESITGKNQIFRTLLKGITLKKLYIDFPQLFNIVITIFAGITAGIMSVTAYTFSIVIRKNRMFIFLFSYIFFQFFAMINSVLYSSWSEKNIYICTSITSYMSYIPGQQGKVYIAFALFLLLLLLLDIKLILRKISKDEL